MSNKVTFYEIKITNIATQASLDTRTILRELERQRMLGDGTDYVHNINDKDMTLFRLIQAPNSESFVIPFGSAKAGAVFKGAENANANAIPTDIQEVTEQLFDISSMYYSVEEGLALICCDKSSPSAKNIQRYLALSISRMLGREHEVRIIPIVYNSGIESVRNANIVKSIVIILDLSESVEQVYSDDAVQDYNFLSLFRGIAYASRDDMGAKTFKLEIGIGHGSRNIGLSVRNAIDMLTQLNLNTDAIKEVKVKYKNGGEDPISVARLKDSMLELSYTYTSIDSPSVTPVILSLHADTALGAKRNIYRAYLRNREI